ncbi:MAG: hypothetical protein V4640_14055 [Verrucomicrobiota bacterium]
MKLALHLLPLFVVIAARWVAWHEQKILRHGVPLTPKSMADATRMGVAHPEKIRLMRVDAIPALNGRLMTMLARWVPEISANTVGLTLGHGIYIRSPWWGNRHLIAHECVHTGQYERYGSAAAFLTAYFTQCIQDGYPAAAMEQEAILRSAEIS